MFLLTLPDLCFPWLPDRAFSPRHSSPSPGLVMLPDIGNSASNAAIFVPVTLPFHPPSSGADSGSDVIFFSVPVKCNT